MSTILVIYYSGTGNTAKMAELVAEGAAEGGTHAARAVAVEQLDLAVFAAADAYAFGSPDYFTYMAGQMKTFFDRTLPLVKKVKGKPFVSFLSHGGGGGGIDSLDKLGQAIGLVRVAEGVKCVGAPAGKSAEECRQLGRTLAKALK